MEKFGYDWTDDDGTLYEVLYWTTKGRCFRKFRVNGTEGKTKRVSESEFMSAYETYRNY